MPSFDIVSKIDQHELSNAVDQANRELNNRFDFKNVEASFHWEETTITLKAPDEFQVGQMLDILQSKFIKRNIDSRCLEPDPVQVNLGSARQVLQIKQGIDKTFAKTINQCIKDSKVKVQSSIQGDQLRVTGKKKDELQDVIAFLKQASLELPVQFENFRD